MQRLIEYLELSAPLFLEAKLTPVKSNICQWTMFLAFILI